MGGGHLGVADLAGVATDVGAVCGQHLGEALVLSDIDANDVPFVRVAGDHAEGATLAASADEERQRRLRGLRVAVCVLELEVFALERCGAFRPERLHDLDALLEAVHALTERGEGQAEGLVFGDVPAGAHAEDEPTAAQHIDLGGHPREERGVAEGHGADERAEADALRFFGDEDEGDEGLQGVAVGGTGEREEVVGAPEGFEPGVLSSADDSAPEVPIQVFLALDHDSEIHTFLLVCCRKAGELARAAS